jgi:hypothetical protein
MIEGFIQIKNRTSPFKLVRVKNAFVKLLMF